MPIRPRGGRRRVRIDQVRQRPYRERVAALVDRHLRLERRTAGGRSGSAPAPKLAVLGTEGGLHAQAPGRRRGGPYHGRAVVGRDPGREVAELLAGAGDHHRRPRTTPLWAGTRSRSARRRSRTASTPRWRSRSRRTRPAARRRCRAAISCAAPKPAPRGRNAAWMKARRRRSTPRPRRPARRRRPAARKPPCPAETAWPPGSKPPADVLPDRGRDVVARRRVPGRHRSAVLADRHLRSVCVLAGGRDRLGGRKLSFSGFTAASAAVLTPSMRDQTTTEPRPADTCGSNASAPSGDSVGGTKPFPAGRNAACTRSVPSLSSRSR